MVFSKKDIIKLEVDVARVLSDTLADLSGLIKAATHNFEMQTKLLEVQIKATEAKAVRDSIRPANPAWNRNNSRPPSPPIGMREPSKMTPAPKPRTEVAVTEQPESQDSQDSKPIGNKIRGLEKLSTKS